MPLIYEKRDGVAYITLNNPAKANILDKKTSDEISAAWIDLWEDRDIRCAILTGAGERHFCTGADLRVDRPEEIPKPEGAPERAPGFVGCRPARRGERFRLPPRVVEEVDPLGVGEDLGRVEHRR